VLSRLPLSSAWAGTSSTCKTFCDQCPKRQRTQCLNACQACSGDTSRLCGSCGSYVCCAAGYRCCSGSCVDQFNDPYNCGACGNVCQPGPNEFADCLDGQCVYACVEDAVRCNGTCTFLESDPDNCGACGNVCPESAPYCDLGACIANPCIFPHIPCGGRCVDPTSDHENCGGCGNRCSENEACVSGFCESGG
jgi:hypothetical protein